MATHRYPGIVRIDEIIEASDEPVFSFEFFPPKTPAGEQSLFAALGELRAHEPAFVSVTWGAGGSTREKTIAIVKRIKAQYGLEAMAHFTCVGATVPELHAVLREMREAGIDNVLALRGDPPAGEGRFVAARTAPSWPRWWPPTTTSASSARATPRSIPRRRTRAPT